MCIRCGRYRDISCRSRVERNDGSEWEALEDVRTSDSPVAHSVPQGSADSRQRREGRQAIIIYRLIQICSFLDATMQDRVHSVVSAGTRSIAHHRVKTVANQ